MLSFFKKKSRFSSFRNFENFELFFLHDEKIFSIPIFFTDLDYVSRVSESYLEHSRMSSEGGIDCVWEAFSSVLGALSSSSDLNCSYFQKMPPTWDFENGMINFKFKKYFLPIILNNTLDSKCLQGIWSPSDQ